MDTKQQLLQQLNKVDAARENRLRNAHTILNNPQRFGALLEIGCTHHDRTGSKACWILEFVLKERLSLLVPYLDYFCDHLSGVKESSSIRPVAKICQLLVLEKRPAISQKLTDTHKEKLVSACFDWLIGPTEVAPQAYAMSTLFELGKSIAWVHPELQLILEQGFPNGSPGYQSRARKVLESIRKRNKTI